MSQSIRPTITGGRSTATARKQIPPVPFRLSCYKCRKPVANKTTFCRCPCSCVVCFECADQQFNKLERTDCPSCKQVVDPEAILAFEVGARPGKPTTSLEASLQKVFVPLPTTPHGSLTFDGMKRRALSNIEHMKVEVNFLLTNIMRENMNQFRHNNGMRKQLQSQQATLKDQNATIQALHDKHRQEIAMRDQRIAELGEELGEQKEMVRKFRAMSSSSVGSGSRRAGSQQHAAPTRGVPAAPFPRPQNRVAPPLFSRPHHNTEYDATSSYNTNLAGPENFDDRSLASSQVSGGGIRQGLDSSSAFRMPTTSHINKRRRVSDRHYDDVSTGHRRSSPGSAYQGSSGYGGRRY